MSQIKVELQNIYGNDRSIAEAAWTSSLDYQKKQTRTEDDVKRVVNMLADSKHSTPFESVIFRFWMKVPIQTDRQIMTHRLQSTSGMSGRYRTMPNEYLELPNEVYDIVQKLPNKQNQSLKGKHVQGTYDWIDSYYEVCEKANHYYQAISLIGKEAEQNGLISKDEYKRVREFYRGMLPQNNMTERVSIMNLRAFSNFIKLRNSPHAQPEIRKVAEFMLEQVKQIPEIQISIEALERNNWEI